MNEQCFRDHHLEFAGKTFLEFGNGTRIPIQGRFLSNGTTPAGSQWAMNPLPFASGGHSPEFEPPCIGTHDLENNTEWGLCAGRFPIDVTIVDVLKLPADLAAGAYVDLARRNGSTALQIACERGHTECAALLLAVYRLFGIGAFSYCVTSLLAIAPRYFRVVTMAANPCGTPRGSGGPPQ